MAAPIVSWTEKDGSTPVTEWKMGKINAGEAAPSKTFLIWNNREGEEDVSDMQDTQITVTDGVGDELDVVAKKWTYVQCYPADSSFVQVGGDTMHMIQASGTDSDGNEVEEGIIKGTANSGLQTDTTNYAKVEAYVHPDLNAPAGIRSYFTRVVFYYT